MKYVLLEMPVRREIYRRERNVTEQASTGSTVKTKDAELSNDVHSTFRHSTFHLGRFALDLEANFSRDQKSETCSMDEKVVIAYTISNGFVKTLDQLLASYRGQHYLRHTT